MWVNGKYLSTASHCNALKSLIKMLARTRKFCFVFMVRALLLVDAVILSLYHLNGRHVSIPPSIARPFVHTLNRRTMAWCHSVSDTERFYNKLLQNIEPYSYGNCLFCLCWCNLITDSVDSIKDNFNSQRKMLQTITILFVYAFDSFSFHCQLNVVSFFPRFYSHNFIIIAKCVCTFS